MCISICLCRYICIFIGIFFFVYLYMVACARFNKYYNRKGNDTHWCSPKEYGMGGGEFKSIFFIYVT